MYVPGGRCSGFPFKRAVRFAAAPNDAHKCVPRKCFALPCGRIPEYSTSPPADPDRISSHVSATALNVSLAIRVGAAAAVSPVVAWGAVVVCGGVEFAGEADASVATLMVVGSPAAADASRVSNRSVVCHEGVIALDVEDGRGYTRAP